MKLDRYRPKDRSKTAIVFKEIDAPGCDGGVVNRPGATEILTVEKGNQPVLPQVVEIALAILFIPKARDLVRFVRIAVPKMLQQLALQCTTYLHLPGLRGLRFEWSQNDITDWPGTLLRPG